jgi:hypothetical protein
MYMLVLHSYRQFALAQIQMQVVVARVAVMDAVFAIFLSYVLAKSCCFFTSASCPESFDINLFNLLGRGAPSKGYSAFKGGRQDDLFLLLLLLFLFSFKETNVLNGTAGRGHYPQSKEPGIRSEKLLLLQQHHYLCHHLNT